MKNKEIIGRIETDVKRHIHEFAEIVPDQITGNKYAVVRRNVDGVIIKTYTNYYILSELKIAVDNFINGMFYGVNDKEL